MNIFRGMVGIIVICFFINIQTNTIYGDDNIHFENITIDDGLSQSTVETIIQDSDGYMWIGTNDGLNRYNGVDIKVYKSDEENKNSIISNNITSMAEDNNKNLWIGTVNGITKMNLKDDSITNYRYDENNKINRLTNIHTILITKSGHVLIGTCNGLYKYNERNDSFEKLSKSKSILNLKEITDLKEDNNDNLWVATEKGLYKINTRAEIIDKINLEDDLNRNELKIDSLLYDKYGDMWVSTYDNGVYRINTENNQISKYKSDEKNKNAIPSNSTRDMTQDSEGAIWISTEKGLSKYIKKEDKFVTYKNRNYDNSSLASDIVYTVVEDSSGLIWVGTYTGISIFDPRNEIIQYKSDPLNRNSLSDNVIHGIYEDNDGILWVGTRNKGINIIDREKDEFKNILEGDTEYTLNSNSIRDIVGKDNRVWIGTRNGVNEIDKNTMKINKYTIDDGLGDNNIKTLLVDSKGFLWVGTTKGINIINPDTKEILDITYLLKNNGITDTYIEEIYEDSNGIYWFGSMITGKLIKLNPKKNNIKSFETYKGIGELEAFNNEEVSSIKSITEDKKGNLWIGTDKGLVRFNIKKETIRRYTDKDGLSNNTVYGVLIDENGNPWASTNNGISMMDVKSSTSKITKFRNFSSTDGLQSNEFNGKAYYKSKSGEFIFGGVKGLNTFYPEKINKNTESQSIKFDSFEVEGKEYKNIDGMSFKYNENLVRIKFFIPHYKKNNNIKYTYKLSEIGENWVTSNINEVIYSELSPGTYTFRVKAIDKNGTMIDESSVRFTINQPFWLSDKAILVYAILVGLLSYINAIRMKKLDKLVEKRTVELSNEMEKNNILLNKVIKAERSKNNYFINLSHELRTPLNVISSIEQLISNLIKSEKAISNEKLDYYMSVMQKNTNRLLNLINNIIDTTKIENGKYKIFLENNDIVYIVEETTLTLKDIIESSGVELIIDTDVEEKIIKCDKYEIERCIVNLVSNAAKFTPSGGTITVDIRDMGERVRISVEDTGTGIDEKHHKFIFDRFNQIVDEQTEVKGGSGLGLTITKHIVDLHNGQIYVESEKDKGTKFTIILPVEPKK